jgi:benzil reductase ((S)-benzoin forming)
VPKPLTIVITGASRGLGAGMARYFYEAGHRLGLCSRSGPVLESSERVVAQNVDVRDAQAVQSFSDAVVKTLGPIDLWIGNAGVLEPMRQLRDVSLEEFESSMGINVSGVFNGTKSYIHHVRGREGIGTLVNISSGAALKGYASWGAYCASKAAVDRLTECALLEEAASGLRAYSIAPGVIDTDMQVAIRAASQQQFPMVQKFIDLKEQEAFNTPPFIAQKILELALEPGAQSAPVVQRLPEEPR